MKNFFCIFFVFFTTFASNSWANQLGENFAPKNINSGNCWADASKYHNVDMWLLISIAYVESRFKFNAINVNKNGSIDLGVMQINTIWLPELNKFGINKDDLFDPCKSIFIGAWILSKNIKQYGYTWRAIGAYNSRTPSIAIKYATKVYEVHKKLTGVNTNFYQLQ